MKTNRGKGNKFTTFDYRFLYPVVFFTLLLYLAGKGIGLTATESNLFRLFLPLVQNGDLLMATEDSGIKWIEEQGPSAISFAEAVSVNLGGQEYLYVIGGGTQNSTRSKLVTHAQIQPDGSLGPWSQDDSPLPLALKGHSVVATDKLIYVFGGENNLAGSNKTGYSHFIYCAELDANTGQIIGGWHTLLGELPTRPEFQAGVAFHASVMGGGGKYVYLIGGTRKNAINHITYTNHVWSAETQNSCDKQLKWRKEPPLEAGGKEYHLANHTAVSLQHQGKELLFVMGGGTRDYNQSTVIVAEINKEGRIQEWRSLPQFAGQGLQLLTAVHSGDYLYLLGGSLHVYYNCFPGSTTIYRAKLVGAEDTSDSTELLSDWEMIDNLPLPVYGHAAVTSELDRIYLVGGTKNSDVPGVTNEKCHLDAYKQSLKSEALATVYWSPLLFFTKESSPQDIAYPGKEISYTLTAISNNVRDLHDVTITDTLPANLQLIAAPGFTFDGQMLTASGLELPINHRLQLTFTAVVSPTNTATPNGPILPSKPEPQITATPESVVQPTEANIRPTQVKGCAASGDTILSGTPRPRPTCTPTSTPTTTPTYTDTPTPTPTDTPTVATTPPNPVVVVNQAFFCFVVEQRQWCKMATAVTAPFHTYLPIVTK